MENIRVRFAPSPTGALHIGGVRTALYNYLLAKKTGGTFILRIEDTDQTRYVEGAEKYIVDALNWCGLKPDEGHGIGGEYGPYRQSERKELYLKFAHELVEKGTAYYAFDSAEALDKWRNDEKEKGNHSPQYGTKTRMSMENSLSLSESEVKERLDSGNPYTIRLKVPVNEDIVVQDMIRGSVTFNSDQLDDKILLKGDKMPTYHLANIVDDYSMKISHVIRGEEWLPSTAHHVLLYRAFGWEDAMPNFAHLPLILKPTGKGKLSKRDGDKLGMPVFPLDWAGDTPEDSFKGFREFGFDPNAVVNFLAFLGWNPGTEQEMFSLEQLCEAFSIEGIGKSGARFDFDKAKWFNQQYIMSTSDEDLAQKIKEQLPQKGYKATDEFLTSFCGLMKERVHLLTEFLDHGYYFFEPVKAYDQKTIRKKWKAEKREKFTNFFNCLKSIESFDSQSIESEVKQFMEANEMGFGDVFPILRVGLTGTMKGPSVFEMMELIGKEEVMSRLTIAYESFDKIASDPV